MEFNLLYFDIVSDKKLKQKTNKQPHKKPQILFQLFVAHYTSMGLAGDLTGDSRNHV